MHYLQEIMNIVGRARSLGTRTLENGTQLIGHVPHIAPDAWLHIIFPPLSEHEITALEQEIGLQFPENVRDFFDLCNGIDIFSSSLSIYGLRKTYERSGDSVWQPFDIVLPNVSERLEDAGPSLLFIGGCPKGTGYYYYVDTKNGSASRCNRMSAKPLETWGSFEELLVKKVSRLASYYDDLGRRAK